MRRVLKGLFRFIFAVIPLVLLVGGIATLWLSRSLPPTAGTVTIENLSGPVTIARDENGVPHIRGGMRDDVLAGLGFAHAQDRLWQMEVARMAGQGRLSEIFGEATVATDEWLRTMGIYEAAAASYETFPPDAKQALEAYTRGVNAWMNRQARPFSSKLPPEFVILQHQPEPWRPQDSVVVIKMMSIGLSANIGDEIDRLALAHVGLGAAEIGELMPPVASQETPALPDIAALIGLEGSPVEQASLKRRPGDIAIGGLTGRGNSNNWVVSGRRTETGTPILANDPHLALSAPSIWYLAHLRTEEGGGVSQNLAGATLAGAPLVLLGRNDAVAWGFTNTASDVQDLFVERTDPDDPGRYLTPDGWADFGVEEETIRVSGGEDHVFTRRWTRHGPVLPRGYRGLDALLPEGTVGALAWTALAEDDHTMISGLNLWDVETVEDYVEGMRDFVVPMQSMVVADTAGDIGLVAPGRVPVRDPANAVMGRAPVPGWNSTYDWQGVIAYEDLPRRLNPESGVIGTANSRIVGDDYAPLLTLDWDEAYRQNRIGELIEDAEAPHTMAASRDAQMDVHSPFFAAIMPKMLAAVDDAPNADTFVRAALGDWDFQMARDRPEPLIAVAWLREAMIGIFRDDLGAAFDGWFQARGAVMDDVLSGRTDRNWCDRRDTSESEDCATILVPALERALDDLDDRYGSDRTAWRWGEAHRTLGEHRPFGQVRPLDRLFNVTVESGGGPFTLNRGQTDLSSAADPFINRVAASFRGIYDLSDLDNSTYMISTGQSGNVFSGNYRDMAQPWRDGEAIKIMTDPSIYERDAAGVWQIVP